jgi:tetratricopeptide (TPR) repeat protein
VNVPRLPPDVWTPEDEVASRRRQGLRQKLWWAFRQHLPIFGMLIGWIEVELYFGRPYSYFARASFVALPLYFLWFVRLVVPMMMFQLILEASVWHDWKRLRLQIRVARVLKKFITTAIPDKELDLREAASWAAEGRLADGLQLVEKYRGHPDVAEYLFLTRLSGIYDAAGQYDRVVALLEEAAAKGPGGVSEWIDLAMARIRRKRDAAGAKSALRNIEGREVPALAQSFRLIVEGMIACEERDNVRAYEYFRTGLEKLQATAGSPLIQGLVAEGRAGMAIALARLDKRDVARKILARERPLLEARKEKDLLARCDEALAG